MSISKKILELQNTSYLILKDKFLLLRKADKSLPNQKEFSQFLESMKAKKETLISEKEFNYSAFSVFEKDDFTIPNDFDFYLLREYLWEKDNKEGDLASRAMGISNWRNSMQFCNHCGKKLEDGENETCRVCKNCGTVFFPRISPCVIVLVTNGNKMLLAKHKMRNTDIFTCIAGFIEHGEKVEECVHREVKEETGLNVKNVQYKGSQPWPFPDQLMLAYRAEYESGEIKVQEEELKEAAWFSKDKLPSLPKPGRDRKSVV